MATVGKINIEADINLTNIPEKVKQLIAELEQLGGTAKANFDKFQKELDELRRKAGAAEQSVEGIGKVAGKGGGMFGKLGSVVGSTVGKFAAVGAAVGAAYMAVRTMTSAVSSWIEASNNQEIALAKLEQGLRNVGDASQETIKALTDQASALQNLTGYHDEEIMHAQAMLTTFALTGDEIQMLTPQILNMAASFKKAGKDMDLQQIAVAVGKAVTMGAGALSRYGIVLSDAQAKQLEAAKGMERIRLVTEILAQNFDGLAEAVGNTTAGKMARFSAMIGDIQETLGDFSKVVVSNILDYILPVVQNAIEWLNKHKTTIIKTIKVIIIVVIGAVKSFVGWVRFLADLIGTSAGGMIRTLGVFRDYFVDTFSNLKSVLSGFGKLFVHIFTGQWGKVKEDVEDITNGIKNQFKDTFGAKGEIESIMRGSREAIKESFQENIVAPAQEAGEKAAEAIYGGIIDSKDDLKAAGIQAGQEIGQGVAEGLSESDYAWKTALELVAQEIGMTAEEIEKEFKIRKLAENITKQEEEIKQTLGLIKDEAKETNKEIAENIKETAKEVHDEFKLDLQNPMESFFERVLTAPQDIAEAFKQLFKTIEQELIKLAAKKIVISLLSSLATGGVPITLFAEGGLAGGTITAAATGTMFTRPTLALLGERQPEVVMPEVNFDRLLDAKLEQRGVMGGVPSELRIVWTREDGDKLFEHIVKPAEEAWKRRYNEG